MKSTPRIEAPHATRILQRNVNALVKRKKDDLKKRSLTEKFVSKMTFFFGSMTSFYVHFALFGIWVVWNMGLMPFKPFDPSFIILATFAGVEAIFLTTFVLIGQKHMNVQAEKWADLDLQISLLTEHEVTKILKLVTALAKKMKIEVLEDKEIQELSKDIHPDNILDTMAKASN
jgi:uncharacterized membrane protein